MPDIDVMFPVHAGQRQYGGDTCHVRGRICLIRVPNARSTTMSLSNPTRHAIPDAVCEMVCGREAVRGAPTADFDGGRGSKKVRLASQLSIAMTASRAHLASLPLSHTDTRRSRRRRRDGVAQTPGTVPPRSEGPVRLPVRASTPGTRQAGYVRFSSSSSSRRISSSFEI
jgi:hypothetical protein